MAPSPVQVFRPAAMRKDSCERSLLPKEYDEFLQWSPGHCLSLLTCSHGLAAKPYTLGRKRSGKTLSLALVRRALPIVCSSLFYGFVSHQVSLQEACYSGALCPEIQLFLTTPRISHSCLTHHQMPHILVSETRLVQATNHRLLSVGAEKLQAAR